MGKIIKVLISVAMLATPALPAAAAVTATPLPSGPVTVRFNRSVPTLQLDDAVATVNVTPLPNDHGRMAFAVGAFNKTNTAFNFGTESISATLSDGTHIYILTKDDLVRKAKNRAMWASIAIAAAGGLAAASAASYAGQHTYNSTFYTPNGAYRYSGTYVNYTERALVTGAAAAGTGYALGTIQSDLDRVTSDLGENVLQTTTVDPGTAYGGMVVIDKAKLQKGAAKLTDQNLVLTVNVGGRAYPFTFDLK